MAGYNWAAGMSNNAVEAYSNGEMPISKWTKSRILDSFQKELNLYFEYSLNGKKDYPLIFENKEKLMSELKKIDKKTLQEMLLEESSYHHTSKFFNITFFYKIDIEGALSCRIPNDERFEKYYE